MGGLYAFDVPNGEARIDVNLDGNTGPRAIHILDRYDMNSTYIITDGKCTKNSVTGSLSSPWEWVASASYVGISTYEGNTLYDWQLTDKTNTTLKVSVLQSDVNKPVFFSSRYVNGSEIDLTEIIFLEFNASTPEAWVFYIPKACDSSISGVGADPSGVIYFANSQWDCAEPTCASRVPAGSGQPGYECAEFVARSLAYGGYFPGLSATAPQSTYLNWKGYDLCYTTHLASALASVGFKKLANSGSSVNVAVAIFGNAGDGSFSHTCIGIGANTVDCHNNARKSVSGSGEMYLGIDAVYGP
jgi:hypothetical protein